VYLRAELTDWGQHNLMQGPVQVFFEGSYIGESALNPGTTDDTLRISLGRDPLVTLKREAIRDYTSRRAIGTNVREERGYKITVRNSRRNTIRLRLVEQLPVSTDSRIEVEPLEITGWQHNTTRGELTVQSSLDADATWEGTYRFSVKYPKELPVQGL
jgi:hypothetical protein